MSKSSPRKRRSLDGWLGEAQTPLFVLDRDMRLRVFNSGCEALTGWPAADVLGQECRYASVSDELTPTALGNSLCPPPEAREGSEVIAPAFIPAKNGLPLARLLHFFPLHDAEGKFSGVLGLITNILAPPTASAVPPSRQLHAELAAVRMQLRDRFGAHSLIAHGPAMKKVLEQLQLAQAYAAGVLLQGELGTGREHLARHIHFGSPARAQWFVPLDCRRLDPQDISRIVERLPQVHRERGATGSAPQPGTLFLAEVETLARDLQEKIVVAFASIGRGATPQIRLMASSTSPLRAEVGAGRVLPEFDALVSTLTISVPPLRERGDDIQLLAQHFLEEVNREGAKQVSGFDETIWPAFLHYEWPGNLDELSAVVREAHARCSEPLIKLTELPFRFRSGLEAQESPPPLEWPKTLLDPLLARVETRLITLALERSKYNKSRAAELLGINRARLYRRMEQLGIEDREAAREPAESESSAETGGASEQKAENAK